MSNVISVGISFPKKVLTKIDSERGDISRSRYLLRAIQNTSQREDKEGTQVVQRKENCGIKKTSNNHQDSLDSRSGNLQSSESGNRS
jgi:metal-responsive CopG/Arc/MetJ family transcriptional regulator